RESHQHQKAFYVTFTLEYTNIIGLLEQVKEIFTLKSLLHKPQIEVLFAKNHQHPKT
ncbi:unnamed protein product, partial [Musa hybrid cultivar]